MGAPGPVTLARAISFYLLLQGMAIGVWWVSLMREPWSRFLYKDPLAPDSSLLAFFLADLALVAAGSVIAGELVRGGSSRRVPALWFVAGAMSFAALYCVGLTLLTGGAWIPTFLMVPAGVLTLACAVLATPTD